MEKWEIELEMTAELGLYALFIWSCNNIQSFRRSLRRCCELSRPFALMKCRRLLSVTCQVLNEFTQSMQDQ